MMAKLVFGMLLGLAVAMALLAAGANAVSCTTNGGSPTQGDANACVQFVRNLGSSQCCQQNGDGACTTMCQDGSAAVQVCGGSNQCTQCSTAGDALNDILAQCVRNVGGTARVSGSEDAAGLEFVITSSNGLRGKKKNTTAQVIEMVRDE
jgi:hypothetical protein